MRSAACLAAGLSLLFPAYLVAVPTEVLHQDLEHCDPLIVPPKVDELGLAPVFPLDELISSAATFTQQAACIHDNPQLVNALVVMTNLTTTAWSDVWYVADPFFDTGAPGTSISNYDGVVDGISPAPRPGLAFKIDTIGVNRPLVFESIAADGIFSAGETWHFIIDDYFNTAGLPPSLFDSIGVASLSTGGPPSSGSIIAVPVPEPGAVTLCLLGGLALLVFRWRRGR